MGVVIKRVYEPAAPEDGTRVLVDRVWPRGVSRERAAVDRWMKEIAPSAALRKWFGHRPERWEAFRSAYIEELEAKPQAVAELGEMARRGRLTLVFAARDEQRNNAVVIRDYLEGAAG